jgi:hypothetical protein
MIKTEKMEIGFFLDESLLMEKLKKISHAFDNDAVFDFAKLYKSYISKPSIQFEVFRSMDDANEWMKD